MLKDWLLDTATGDRLLSWFERLTDLAVVEIEELGQEAQVRVIGAEPSEKDQVPLAVLATKKAPRGTKPA